MQEGVTLLSWKLRALGIERAPLVYWSGIRRGPRPVRLVKAADRIHNIRQAIESRNAGLQQKYLAETERELLPILRDAGETWMADRLAGLLVRLRA